MKTVLQIESLKAEELIDRLDQIEQKLDLASKNHPESSVEKYLTRRQVSELLQVSRQTLSVWHKKGVLIGSRVGTRIRYRYSDVEHLINKQGKNLTK